jgi:hypothetical protein
MYLLRPLSAVWRQRASWARSKLDASILSFDRCRGCLIRHAGTVWAVIIAVWTDNRRNDVMRRNDYRRNDVMRRNDYRRNDVWRNDVRRNNYGCYRSNDPGASRVVPNAAARRHVKTPSTTVAHEGDGCRWLRSCRLNWRSLRNHRRRCQHAAGEDQ